MPTETTLWHSRHQSLSRCSVGFLRDGHLCVNHSGATFCTSDYAVRSICRQRRRL